MFETEDMDLLQVNVEFEVTSSPVQVIERRYTRVGRVPVGTILV